MLCTVLLGRTAPFRQSWRKRESPIQAKGKQAAGWLLTRSKVKNVLLNAAFRPLPMLLCKKERSLILPLPYVVKVPCQGSSVGVYLVKAMNERDAALEKAFAQADTILVEAFVSGRELTVGIMGESVLPIIEIRPRGGFYSYENKYTWTNRGGAAEHECPARLSRREKAMSRISRTGRAPVPGIGDLFESRCHPGCESRTSGPGSEYDSRYDRDELVARGCRSGRYLHVAAL